MEKLNLVKSNYEQLPSNIEAEQAILGSILVSNEILDEGIEEFTKQLREAILSGIESPKTPIWSIERYSKPENELWHRNAKSH